MYPLGHHYFQQGLFLEVYDSLSTVIVKSHNVHESRYVKKNVNKNLVTMLTSLMLSR